MDYLFSFFIFMLGFVKVNVCDTGCMDLDVFIAQKVENQGFHRQIHWLIEITAPPEKRWLRSGCNLTLQLGISSGMFVNPDEISELNRFGQPHIKRYGAVPTGVHAYDNKLSAYVDGQVDTERAAHEAKEHTLYIFLPNRGIELFTIKFPIHLRYQRSQIGGGFGKVQLRKPNLLGYCQESLKKICGKGVKVEAPCTVAGTEMCVWKNLSYASMIDDTELFVPVGDLDDYPVVAIVTLLLGCAGCIYILSILSTRPL